MPRPLRPPTPSAVQRSPGQGRHQPYGVPRHTFALAEATGSDAYEPERRLDHQSQRYIHLYISPSDDIAAGCAE